MASSIPAARLNLFNLLVAAFSAVPTLRPTEQPTVQVTYGPPEEHAEEHEVVAILGVDDVETDWSTLGATNNQEERYAINLRCKVWDPTCDGSPADLQTIDQQVWLFYDTIRGAVNDNPQLAGALSVFPAIVATGTPATQGSSGESPVPALDDPGWVAFVDCSVVCRSRIT